MKKPVSILIMFSILFSSLGQTIIFIHYIVNTDYYATVLCENKAKPAMHCNGKCHMVKEMKEQERREQSPTVPVKEKQETVQLFHSTLLFAFNSFNEIKKPKTIYLPAESQEVVFSIFHPPSA